ncbi:MAG TPA: outer membrane protein assembly factor BamA [Xanthobacteraceae bacterium]|jgi:outer membrane protein insertion porin family|nr:outer membrane protein assembly factor BamA [Xanthobacteraceae bacterium]
MRYGGLAFILACFLIVAGCAAATAADAGDSHAADSAITVNGNQRIGADMIRSYFNAGSGGHFDAAALDDALKRLYATGLFKDVKIAHEGDRVLVMVVENPTVAVVAFEGNHKLKDEDLKKAVQSKAGGPLSRAFVQSDTVAIVEFYRQRGYFEVSVTPKSIDARNGRINLVFEIKEGGKLAVRQVQFAGNGAFSASKLKAVIKTGVTNVLSFLLDNDTYDADRIENDRDLLRRFYLAHGYADVHVTSSSNYDPNLKSVAVTFKINEGALYRFGRVELGSNVRTVDAAGLHSVLHMQTGDVYDADAVAKGADGMTVDLAKSGEPFVAVTSRNERRSDRRVIDVIYTVEQGKRLYVERIELHGNTKTHDEVIRREFDFGEGDAYNRALVDRGERHLKALGYFKTVQISTEPGSAPDRVVVDVTVEEKQTGNFFVSGGYSTTDGWLASVTLSDSNFLGTGNIAKSSFTYGQYARGFDVSLTDPWFLGQRLSLGGELFGKQTFANTYQTFNISIYGARVSVGSPINDNLGVSWNYAIYNQGISLDPALGTASLPIQQATAAGSYWVSSVGNSVTYSTLDNARNPTNGFRVQTSNEIAGLGGAAKFAKTTEDVRYYHEIAGDVIGMVRTQGGYVTPWGGQHLPLLDGFFGGPQLVRGFAPNGFGPRDITPGTTMDNLGGNAYWTTSAELQSPVPFVPQDAGLKMAVFSDTGSLWATSASSVASLAAMSPSQQIANSRAIRSSVGVGLVWDSMFGPLRVDYAYPIAKQPFDVTQRLQFTAGGF